MTLTEWHTAFKAALSERFQWLSSTEIPRLRETFRHFHTAYSILYNSLVKKGVIPADPYKNDAKMTSLTMPEIGPLPDAGKRDKFGLRLANYDNQLDFVVNFYTLSVETLTQDKLKILLSIVKFIDWLHTTPDSPSHNTQAMSEIITRERHNPGDPIAAKSFNDCLAKLEKGTVELSRILKEFSDYNREAYKGDVREKITASMEAAAANVDNIKKKFGAVFKDRPFYAELISEIITEDYSAEAEAARQQVLKKLAVEDKTQKTEKAPASYKPLLIEGLAAIGSAGSTLEDMLNKINQNHEAFQSKKKSFGGKIRDALSKIFNKKPDPVIYLCDSVDPATNTAKKEKIEYDVFRDELERKCKILQAVSVRGPAIAKLEAMKESQLLELLDKNIRDVQTYHRQFTALDKFFKSVPSEDIRGKMKGIMPELSTLKNASAKASSKKQDYLAVQEEAAQFKKLGIEVV